MSAADGSFAQLMQTVDRRPLRLDAGRNETMERLVVADRCHRLSELVWDMMRIVEHGLNPSRSGTVRDAVCAQLINDELGPDGGRSQLANPHLALRSVDVSAHELAHDVTKPVGQFG